MGTRLSGLDASFLAVETPSAHMHVGWVARFSGAPAGARMPSFGELREHIERRLVRAPRYRQKLAPVPFNLNSPEWVDDEAFSIDRHLFWAPGPLHGLVDEVMSMPLRRDRPLWEMWICEEPEEQPLLADRQGPPLHGRRARGGRARLDAAGHLRPRPRLAARRSPGARRRSPAASGCSCAGVRDLLAADAGLLRAPVRARDLSRPRRALGRGRGSAQRRGRVGHSLLSGRARERPEPLALAAAAPGLGRAAAG